VILALENDAMFYSMGIITERGSASSLRQNMKSRNALFILFVLLFVLSITPVYSQAASIVVAPAFRPGTSLTSLDSVGSGYPTYEIGDDYRYVDFDIVATHNIQFWTAQFTCTAPIATLETYTWDEFAANLDSGDDIAPVRAGDVWGWNGTDYVSVEGSVSPTGARTITLTRLGSIDPIGANGVSQTNTLATLRFRVKPQTLNPFSGSAAITCTASFLNRNGAPVAVPVMTAAVPLTIRSGFGINGVAQYQARTVHTGIGVYCDYMDDGTDDRDFAPPSTTKTGVTALNGSYSFLNIRNAGWYECSYWGNGSTVSVPAWDNNADTYLASAQWVYVDDRIVNLLPVTLRLGDVDRDFPSGGLIELNDLIMVTANFGNTVLFPVPYIGGDANGDRKTNNVDLALVSANLYRGNYVPGVHYIASFWTTSYLSSRIYITNEPLDNYTLPVSQLIAGTNADFWPALSPDGTRLAFVRRMGTGAATRYVLHTAPVTNGVVGAPVRMTPLTGWTNNDFAPSWSPDGTRIAFVCSWVSNNGADYPYDIGSLCVVDANGRNLSSTNSNNIRIFPPAWFDNDNVLYGGKDYHWACPNTICVTDVNTNWTWQFSTNIPGGGFDNIADMPVVKLRGVPTLYYRYFDGTNRQMRFAEFNGFGVDPYELRTAPADAPFHMNVEYYDYDAATYLPITDRLDYIALDYGDLGILFDEYYPDNGLYSGSGCNFVRVDRDFNPATPEWYFNNYFYFSGQNCNPWWNGVEGDWTELHALRNTINFVP
jgi:hypothetical protein